MIPKPKPPPVGAWSVKRGLGPFHPEAHFCTHCCQEIGPGDQLWAKKLVVLCRCCIKLLMPQYLN